jgi:hypothetical protein
MSRGIDEWRELSIAWGQADDEGLPLSQIESRLAEIERQFDCKCCGLQSPGMFSPWPDCKCLHYSFRACQVCNRCFYHCECQSVNEKIAGLQAEVALYDKLMDEANRLAVNLGLDEVATTWSIDELMDLEQELRVKLLAIKRLARRYHEWEEAYIYLNDFKGKGDDEETDIQLQ